MLMGGEGVPIPKVGVLFSSSSESKGVQRTSAPVGPNSFNFMQFLGKFGKIVYWCPPGVNPGSTTVLFAKKCIKMKEFGPEGCVPRPP